MALNPRVKNMVQLSSKSNSSLFYLKKKKCKVCFEGHHFPQSKLDI